MQRQPLKSMHADKAYSDGRLIGNEAHTIVLVCEGTTYKEVAPQMDASEQLVKNRLSRVF
jgi:DNA-binding NarL/FixJ family response regulator